jgi:Sulfatase
VTILRLWVNAGLRLVSGTYFVLTSLYCLLAFLPYTYTSFIKAPPYPWMPWLTHHQAILYWLAVAAGAMAAGILRASWWGSVRAVAGICLLGLGGVYLSLRPFLPTLQNNRAAYGWSLIALLPLVGMTAWWIGGADKLEQDTPKNTNHSLPYSVGLLVALVASSVYAVIGRMQVPGASAATATQSVSLEIAAWSLLSHVVLMIAVLSAVNLILLAATKSSRPGLARLGLMGAAIVAALSFVLARFLNNAMSFDGWAARIYAISFALTVTLWGFSLVLPFLNHRSMVRQATLSAGKAVGTWVAILALIGLALASRSLIGGEDWNGFVEGVWVLIFWIAMSVCAYRLRPARARYSAAVIVGVLLASVFLYKGLQATAIFWGRPLGSTDDEISLKLEDYGNRDASFQLAHHVLGNGRGEACGDLCRILREYTNIRDTHITQGVRLVDDLVPAKGDRPDIFIFVIDSMRPDYLGAYNPQQVDYTPNLDALARDSVVFKNVYTQYAGTSLSEPAIWAGAQLLHTHFPQPFDEVNSLRTLAHTDGYQLVASYDVILRQMFSASDDLTKLDTDKELWNRDEVCSTISQLESTMNAAPGKTAPVLFYSQPMNVHQFARNDVPSPTSQNWHGPAGLNGRITYEVHWVDSCLGGFFAYLKQHGLYDNSIIVIASDHGDATGEFGRISHSTSIWPEVMHVPLIMHVPPKLRKGMVYDENRLSTLTDIAPTLYFLLGHRPIRQNALYGRPLFAETKPELDRYERGDLLLASDVRAVYGILTADGKYLYTTYDSPSQSYLFDLTADPNAQRNVLTPALKQKYDEEIIEQLHFIGDYYGYRPGVGSLLASGR